MKSIRKYINYFIREEKGVITVWLTLLTIFMIIFLTFVIEITKGRNAQSICKQNINIANMSCMADYDIEVKENYHIYVMSIEEDIKSALVNKASEYAKSSMKQNENNNRKEFKDIMGLELEQIKVLDVKYIDMHNFIKQVKNYMVEKNNLNHAEVNNKDILIQYIIENFSSYKNPYVKGFMKRKFVYEQEYIIEGKDRDNENMSMIKRKLCKSNISEIQELDFTKEEYDDYMKMMLMKQDIEVLAKRAYEVIITNINNTYTKSLDKTTMIVGVGIEGIYNLKKRDYLLTKIKSYLEEKILPNKIQTNSTMEY